MAEGAAGTLATRKTTDKLGLKGLQLGAQEGAQGVGNELEGGLPYKEARGWCIVVIPSSCAESQQDKRFSCAPKGPVSRFRETWKTGTRGLAFDICFGGRDLPRGFRGEACTIPQEMQQCAKKSPCKGLPTHTNPSTNPTNPTNPKQTSQGPSKIPQPRALTRPGDQGQRGEVRQPGPWNADARVRSPGVFFFFLRVLAGAVFFFFLLGGGGVTGKQLLCGCFLGPCPLDFPVPELLETWAWAVMLEVRTVEGW